MMLKLLNVDKASELAESLTVIAASMEADGHEEAWWGPVLEAAYAINYLADETKKRETEKENFRQAWKARLEDGAVFRHALQEIIALPTTEPDDIAAGHWFKALDIARDALAEVDFPENEWSDA